MNETGKKRQSTEKNSSYSTIQKIQQVPGQSPPIPWFGPPHKELEGPRPPLLLAYMKPTQPSLITTWKHLKEEEMFQSRSNESAQ